MKTKLIVVIIALVTALLNWIPAIGKLLLFKTSNRIPLDSVLHAVYYFSIGILIVNIPWIKKKSLFLSLPILFTFSLLIELVQSIIPGRTFSLTDLASNFFGIAVAYILLSIIRRTKEQVT